MARLVAVLDANILFRRYLRDLLLFAALADLFDPRWTDAILDEAMRPLVARGHMTAVQVADDFTLLLFEMDPARFAGAVEAQQSRYTRNPISREELLGRLAKIVPWTVARLQQYADTRTRQP